MRCNRKIKGVGRKDRWKGSEEEMNFTYEGRSTFKDREVVNASSEFPT